MRMIFEASRGYSNIKFGIKNTMATRFTVASVAKQFTAFAIMILYDQGLLQLFKNWIIKEPIKEPSEEFDYNNSNYNLLAWIIEHVSGQAYSEFLEEHIFSKLGMSNTVFDNGLDIIPNKACNYMRDYGVLVRVPYTNNLYSIGAGAYFR